MCNEARMEETQEHIHTTINRMAGYFSETPTNPDVRPQQISWISKHYLCIKLSL